MLLIPQLRRSGLLGATSAALALSCAAAAFGQQAATPAPSASELTQWASYLWHQVDTGTPHPDAANFQFSDARLNQPGAFPLTKAVILFDRMHGEVFTQAVAHYNRRNGSYSGCTGNAQDAAKVVQQFVEYTTEGTYKTSLNDTAGIVKQVQAATNAQFNAEGWTAEGALQTYLSGDALATDGLKVEGTLGASAGQPQSMTPSLANLYALAQEAAMHLHTNGLDRQFDPIAAIRTGQQNGPTKAVKDFIRYGAPDAEVRPVLVVFGEADSLTVTRIDVVGSYILVDGSKGLAFGPYKSTDPKTGVAELLAAHGEKYSVGDTAVAIASACLPVAVITRPGAPWTLNPQPATWPTPAAPTWTPWTIKCDSQGVPPDNSCHCYEDRTSPNCRSYTCWFFFTCWDDCVERRYCTWFPSDPQTPQPCPPAAPGLPGSICDDYWRYK